MCEISVYQRTGNLILASVAAERTTIIISCMELEEFPQELFSLDTHKNDTALEENNPNEEQNNGETGYMHT